MLVRGGADVEVLTNDGMTVLQNAVILDAKECAAFLLEVGAKVLQSQGLTYRPDWFVAMIIKRSRCHKSCVALYGVLRKRWRLADNQRVPRDMITMLTHMVWQSWRNQRWQLNDEQPARKLK